MSLSSCLPSRALANKLAKTLSANPASIGLVSTDAMRFIIRGMKPGRCARTKWRAGVE